MLIHILKTVLGAVIGNAALKALWIQTYYFLHNQVFFSPL